MRSSRDISRGSCGDLSSRYGSGDDFLRTFNPSMQYQYCKNLERCYMGKAPTLRELEREYGETLPETWLEIQVQNLSEFAGVKEKLGVERIAETARQIMFTFPFLKVTELMHFMVLFKGGKYGIFYGAVDPMTIMDALRRYVATTRREQIDACEAARKRREADEARKNAISWEQWQKIKEEGEDVGKI